MSILFPIVLPVILVGDNATIVELPICCAAIMSGAVIGDHISPISDTTILSAVACGCSVESHFKTQAPYALIVAGISLIALISSTTFTVPIWIIFVVGILLIVVIISLLGRNFQN
jgi:Na+/H+ antiporter NhaC